LIPEGAGFASLTVSTSGSVVLAGKLGDGTVLARSLRLGREGGVPVHGLLYNGQGSVQGWITISPDLSSFQGSEVDGELTWIKADQTNSAAKPYASGFPLHGLKVIGGGFVPNRLIEDVLGLEAVSPNTRLSFEGGWGGGVLDNGYFDVLLGVSGANFIQSPLSEENPDQVRLVKLSAKTGLFSGEFRQRGGLGKVVWSGMVVPRIRQGVGWFLRSVPAEDRSVTVHSGRVDLQAK
jgi:hypothetical protein